MEQLISVIVPVYNAEQSIDRCISSLRNQSFEHIEIILVNDGSKDRSLQVCTKHSLEDSRIIVIDKQNGGVSSARNAGLDIAKGDFVMFCDSDDWPEQHWCRDLLAHYQENHLVMCGCYIEGEQSDVPYEVKANPGGEWIKREDFYKAKLSNFNVPWNKIYDRKLIEKHHIRFDPRLTNGEDYLFVLQYLEKMSGDILFLDRCLYHYQWPDGQSLSSKVPDDYLRQCCLFSKEIFTMAERIGVTDRNAICQIKTDFFNEFQRIIISILQDRTVSFVKKMHSMKSVMDTEEYIDCVKDATISSNRLYSMLYRHKNCLGIWIWYYLKTSRRK